MRKLLLILTLLVTFIFNTLTATANNIVQINSTPVNTGVIEVSSKTNTNKVVKLLVQKDNRMYTYNLKNDGTAERFPLQMGNGTYRISVFENVQGNQYIKLQSEEIALGLTDQKVLYLNSIQNINWNNDYNAVKLASQLTKGMTDDEQKIKAVYNYLVNNLRYDYNKIKSVKPGYLPDIDATLQSKKGICYDYSATFAAMLRSLGIPTKLVKGYAVNIKEYHAWNEVYNKKTGKWMIIDTTFDSQMKVAKAKYTMEKPSQNYNKVNEY